MTDVTLTADSSVTEAAAPPLQATRLWGAWATIGLGLAIGLLSMAAQTLVLIVIAVVNMTSGTITDVYDYITGMASNGLVVSLASVASAVVGTALIYVFVRIRGNRNVADYIGFRRISLKTVLAVVGIFILVFIAITGLEMLFNYLSGTSAAESANTTFMTDTYKTAGWLPLLWTAVVIFAPFFEETFFRGFLFVGLEHSRIGVAGTVILTSLVWAALHMQYNLIGMATIVIMGIVVGVIRHKTHSLWAPVLFHMMWNFLALLVTAISLDG